MPPVIAFKPSAPTPSLAARPAACYKPAEYLNAAGWNVRPSTRPA